MSDLAGQNTQQLFRRWRGGDAEAGQAMAQRFSDWYYAIAASRLGDTNGRAPLERACQRFAQNVATVTDASSLSGWAHGIIAEEIATAGGRSNGGDQPNALTRQRRPSELLAQARGQMAGPQIELLAHAYDSAYDIDQVKREADAAGGYPLAVLEARYALKRWLRDQEGVGFTEIPDRPNLDWGPLPLYEGARMSQGKEEEAFEKWMLSDLGLCKDIAEFAAFALALRGGAFEAPAMSTPAPAATPTTPTAPRPTPSATPQPQDGGGGSKLPIIIGVVVVLIIIAVAAVALSG
ncbi:MAG: hypothetical protein H6739_03365 [Alphaproteobacteria bacterium]|nr:hypothetical protein [Alphaproteobacteria bacterium]